MVVAALTALAVHGQRTRTHGSCTSVCRPPAAAAAVPDAESGPASGPTLGSAAS
jgi:hypothetical protein